MEGEDGRKFGLVTLSWSFLLGGFVGMGLVALYAPRSGRETRQKMGETAEALRGKTTGYVRQAKDKVFSRVDEGREMVGREVSGLKSAVAAGRKAYREGKEGHKGK